MNKFSITSRRDEMDPIKFQIEALNMEDPKIKQEILKLELIKLRELGINVFDNPVPTINNEKKIKTDAKDIDKIYSLTEYIKLKIPEFPNNGENIPNTLMHCAFKDGLFFTQYGIITVIKDPPYYRIPIFVTEDKKNRIKLIEFVMDFAKKDVKYDIEKFNNSKIIFKLVKYNKKEYIRDIKFWKKLYQI
jgi:hypothetical protein